MKRKTNLFYTNGPDSKFITFSNYTEALTGNYLSVNSKLFPDNFLCLNIEGLNSTTKELFIKYLVRYYENKLAVIRDYNVHHAETIEFKIYPLAYLLEAILKVVKIEYITKSIENKDVIIGYKYILNFNSETNELIINDEIPSLFDDNFINENNLIVDENLTPTEYVGLITYIGQISECDYYGTYTDIICNIDCENYNEGSIIISNTSNKDEKTITIEDDTVNVLYGWENDTIFKEYDNVLPLYDEEENTYKCNSKLSRLMFNKIDANSSNYGKTLKFNIIIPLFSLVNINSTYQLYSERNSILDDIRQCIILNDKNKHCFDVPLGMWIYADNNEDTFIELIKDKNLNLYPNWSLLISSQFKPFPYSTYKKENATSNNPDSQSIANSFSTFAEVLSKMNEVLDNFNKININLADLQNRISSIEKNLNNIGTIENIQKIDEKVVDIEIMVNNKIEDFTKKMYGYLNNLKWSTMG